MIDNHGWNNWIANGCILGANLACGNVAVLPALENDGGWLIIKMLLSSLQKTVQ
jgi:hypothetical protein